MLLFDSRKVNDTFCPIGIREANVTYHTRYDKYWWKEYEQHGDSMLQMVPIQSLKEHNQYPNMCEDQEPETQLNTTGVAVIDSPAATQESDSESCRRGSNEKQDTDVLNTITMQLSSLDANQADGIVADNPAVFTQQVRRKLAAEIDMDYVHLHDRTVLLP